MHPIDDFAQPGSPGATAVASPTEAKTTGLQPNDKISVHITGTRSGGPAEMMDALYDANGVALNADGTPIPDGVALNVSGIAGAAVLPEFPVDEYAAAKAAGNIALAQSILAEFKALSEQTQSNGGCVEDGVIDAVLDYAYTYLGFQPTDSNPEKFIVARTDVILTKDPITTPSGASATLFDVRLSSRFGG